jgi:hypothetical protein
MSELAQSGIFHALFPLTPTRSLRERESHILRWDEC